MRREVALSAGIEHGFPSRAARALTELWATQSVFSRSAVKAEPLGSDMRQTIPYARWSEVG
jgi:hypothetical protein